MTPPNHLWDDDPEAPPSEEEERAAVALRDALEAGVGGPSEAELARSVRAAHAPTSLDPKVHERILEEAIPSEEEVRAAAALREALEVGEGGPNEAELARSVRAAHAPEALDAKAHERILARTVPPASPRSNVVRMVFGGGVATALAAAAAAALWLSAPRRDVQATAVVASHLVPRRSSQDLFDDPFPREGGGSARVDRIASARSRDLRANRFAGWGVR